MGREGLVARGENSESEQEWKEKDWKSGRGKGWEQKPSFADTTGGATNATQKTRCPWNR